MFAMLAVVLPAGCTTTASRRPSCRQPVDPNSAIASLFTEADRIIIGLLPDEPCEPRVKRTESGLYFYPPRLKQLKLISRAEELEAFREMLRVKPNESGLHCMCDGSPVLQFYRADHMLAEISIHHGESLRWSPQVMRGLDGEYVVRNWFSSDLSLLPAASKKLIAYLAASGLE